MILCNHLSIKISFQQSPVDALKMLWETSSWESFVQLVANAKQSVDLTCMENLVCQTFDNIASQYIDERYIN